MMRSASKLASVLALMYQMGQVCPAIGVTGTWSDGFGVPPGQGMNERVTSLAEYGGELVAGGVFTQAGSNPTAQYIARFNGTRWKQLQGGMNGSVWGLCSLGGTLYAGGNFSVAGGTTAAFIAAWSGTEWTALGAGTDDVVLAIAPFEGDVVTGGFFTSAGGMPASRVARWDGAGWASLGGGVGGGAAPFVQAVQEFEGLLYAGGFFTSADGQPVTHLARWDGTSWSDFGVNLVPGGAPNLWPVHVLQSTADGDLVIGGDFTHIGGEFANGVALWDGDTWTPIGAMGLSVPAQVVAATMYHGDLVVFGQFEAPGGGLNVARWDGVAWSALGSGTVPASLGGGMGAIQVSGGALLSCPRFLYHPL